MSVHVAYAYSFVKRTKKSCVLGVRNEVGVRIIDKVVFKIMVVRMSIQ